MRRGFAVALLALALCFAGSAVAAPIAGVTVESVSSEFVAYGWDLAASHVVDGSGLSGGLHDVIAYPGSNSWQTISQSGTANIVFDLGALYDLGSLHVWNLNFYAPYNGRGAYSVDILTSTDNSVWSSTGNYIFAMATGVTGDPGFDIDASAWDLARYVQFDIKSNWGGYDNAGHVGLSEVQFFAGNPTATPEPSTLVLAALGLAGALVMRRRLSR